MLLVDRDPFNSPFKIQHSAVAAVPWRKPWCVPKSCRAWSSAGVRACKPGRCLPQLAHSTGGIPSCESTGKATLQWGAPLQTHSPSTGLFQIFLGDLESGFRQQHIHKCRLFELNPLGLFQYERYLRGTYLSVHFTTWEWILRCCLHRACNALCPCRAALYMAQRTTLTFPSLW